MTSPQRVRALPPQASGRRNATRWPRAELMARAIPERPLPRLQIRHLGGRPRVAFFARWPGVVKPGTRCGEVICHTDLMATCAQITGAAIPPNAGEDSVSILPALKGQAAKPLREATVHHSIEGKFAIAAIAGSVAFARVPAADGAHDKAAAAQDCPRCNSTTRRDPEERTNRRHGALK